MKFTNYAMPAESVFDVPYGCEMQIGYNENGGVQGTLNRVGSVLNAAGAVAGSAASLGANIATGNVAGAITSGVGAVGSIFNASRDIATAFNSKWQQRVYKAIQLPFQVITVFFVWLIVLHYIMNAGRLMIFWICMAMQLTSGAKFPVGKTHGANGIIYKQLIVISK